MAIHDNIHLSLTEQLVNATLTLEGELLFTYRLTIEQGDILIHSLREDRLFNFAQEQLLFEMEAAYLCGLTAELDDDRSAISAMREQGTDQLVTLMTREMIE